MRNDYLEELKKKLAAEKFRDEIIGAYKMWKNEQAQKDFNDEMVRKTWEYQKKFGFETSPIQGHEFWDNEADAFKHAFGSADLYFKYGDAFSTVGGIRHEWQTKRNPQGEWNMDSWNNNQGRKIAQEIKKEYGDKFYNLSQKERDAIIASKVMQKMRNGELITKPEDKRKYEGKIETWINEIKKKYEGATGGASNIACID